MLTENRDLSYQKNGLNVITVIDQDDENQLSISRMSPDMNKEKTENTLENSSGLGSPESETHFDKESNLSELDEKIEDISVIRNEYKEQGPIKNKDEEQLERSDISSSKKDVLEKEDAGSSAEEPYKCPLCDMIFTSAHSFTQHIRQHNINNQSNTCRICGKTLSSASSLDRHMLVHSGERPFKCKVCNMAFTTNGNMHRHMRTHGEICDEYPDIYKHNKEAKHKNLFKRKSASEPEVSLSKKIALDDSEEDNEPSKITCPVCGRTFLSKYGLDTHMETHPNDPIRCPDCGVISKDYSLHDKHQCLEKELVCNQNESSNSLSVGFQDLSFVDFTSEKFSLVAKSFCEHQTRRPSSAFHKFECEQCKRAFPCGRALQLHKMIHMDKLGTYCPSCKCDFQTPNLLFAHQLKHRSAEHCWPDFTSKDDNFLDKLDATTKKDFLVLFGLKTSEMQNGMDSKIKEEQFENLSYFVFGKPIEADDLSNRVKTEIEVNKHNANSDFADIQSILSLTSKTPLMPCIHSSPVTASPASPPQVLSCVLPQSPRIADSAQASPETPKDDFDHSVSKDNTMQNDEPIVNEELNSMQDAVSLKDQKFELNQNRSGIQSKSFSCHKCTYKSLDKGTLRRHLRTHNGERPFQCVICNYAFTTKANCERHVRKCHKLTTKEEISCAMRYNPNMTDSKDSDLQLPETSQLDTICKYCNVDFKNQRLLRHHLRSLSNSCSRKPFLCTVCKLGFSTKNNCIRHILKQHPHMKEKPNEAVSVAASVSNNDITNRELPVSENSQKEYSDEQPLNLSVRENSPLSGNDPEKNDLCTIEDIVNAAKGLVCLSEMYPPQVEPLDLAVHALDLSVRSNDSESHFVNNSARLPVSINSSLLNISQNSLSVTSNIPNMFLPSEYMYSEESQQEPCKRDFQVNSDFFYNTDRPHMCMYCSSRFTLKSNMDRHIKRKHPEYARPTRSRNYIPTISSNVEKQNSAAVSTETRNALRYVLNSKGVSSFTDQKVIQHDEKCHAFNYTMSILTDAENNALVYKNTSPSLENDNTNEAENAVDLASISDVIDTANCQKFKQYLKEVRNDDKLESNKNKDLASNKINHSKIKDQTSQSKSGNNESNRNRKRSSYADSPNSIACPYCKRKFPWTSSLRRHILTHTGQKPYKCPKCPIWFTTKSNCERHYGRKHSDSNSDFCSRSVPERPYKCNLCTSSTFSTQGNLRKHFYLKHRTKTGFGKSHISGLLSVSKFQKEMLENKLIQKENENLSTIPPNIVDSNAHGSSKSFNIQEASTESSMATYCCHICHYKIPTKEEYFMHIENHYTSSDSVIQNTDEQLSKSSMQIDNLHDISNDNLDNDAQLNIVCAFCPNAFSVMKDFSNHMKLHLTLPDENKLQNVCSSVSLLSTRNKSPNSLLYLMQSSKMFDPTWNANNIESQQEQNEDNMDLIQNLLGIHDSKIIDEMLDSADSAARLLGVKKM